MICSSSWKLSTLTESLRKPRTLLIDSLTDCLGFEMSGFEIAGVVLGSIPIVVMALDYYLKGASTIESFRTYKRALTSLIRVLNAEHAILQDVCEKLLVGIAPQAQIERMIEDPFGALWREKEYSQKLQVRLWRSFKVFESTVLDMREAITDMSTKLNIGPDGKVKCDDRKSFKKLFKRISFVLQKSNHEESMTRIRDGVSSLQKLACLNIEMEPERKLRSQGRLNQLVRDISCSIYQALRSAMTCGCQSAHSVGLRLTPPLRAIVPEDEDKEIVKKLEFGLAISHQLSSSQKKWREMTMQIMENATAGKVAAKPRRSVRFAMTADFRNSGASRPAAFESVVTSFALQDMDPQQTQIENLCDTMKQLEEDCKDCGCLNESQSTGNHKFRIRALECPGSDWALIPIKNILHNQTSSRLGYGDRLRLARIIACGVLQIYGTQWMSSSPTHSNIYLARRQGIPDYQQIFVLTYLPEQRKVTSSNANPVFLSLGILLIELILGQTMDNLQAMQTNDGDMSQLISNYEAAAQLLGRVNMLGGPGYHSAVQRCISDVYGMNVADNNEMMAEAFTGIVGPLEEDLNNLYNTNFM
ncbi:hypothetical protein HJFPF1_09754 [Paramyrothecium foliicola]|nr:hypothetical protein HJFPF1_09754 [Paramyrothecium foliicola]